MSVCSSGARYAGVPTMDFRKDFLPIILAQPKSHNFTYRVDRKEKSFTYRVDRKEKSITYRVDRKEKSFTYRVAQKGKQFLPKVENSFTKCGQKRKIIFGTGWSKRKNISPTYFLQKGDQERKRAVSQVKNNDLQNILRIKINPLIDLRIILPSID